MAKTMAPKTTRRESNGFKTPTTPTDLNQKGVAEITASLKQLLADVFALYLKTKNFHWHMSGAISAIITCCWMSIRTRSSP